MNSDAFNSWVAALEERHLANLRLPEVTRALRALSATYVERRGTMRRGAALGSAGKRAAFALFYAPLHLLTVAHIVRNLGAGSPAPTTIVDIGCGTGAAGAAWALEAGGRSRVLGLDRHRAAVEEARWTYHQLGVDGVARQGDIARVRPPRGDVAIVAAYVLNELPDSARETAWKTLLSTASRGAPVLVVEPIARKLTPWWDQVSLEAFACGGGSDDWRFTADLPDIIQRLDRAAGLDHREITARSIFIPGRAT